MNSSPKEIKDYNKNGVLRSVKYIVEGKINSSGNLYDYFHNENGPALIFYYEDGKIDNETYYLNNNLHNENGPAWTFFRPNGMILSQCYCINDFYHRLDGPAYIEYYLNNIIYKKEYWINNEEILGIDNDNQFKLYVKTLILK